MNSILVVGSVALDSVKTPGGESTEALGGSAVYFSLAARHFAPVKLVGVVGEDFPAAHRDMLAERGIGIAGLSAVLGKTFRWSGSYTRDFNSAETLETQLNVFESFRPRLSPEERDCPVAFLANIDPELQWEVLAQLRSPRLVAADTMNFWISSKRPAIVELLGRVDVLFVNEGEARDLSGEKSIARAARRLAQWGPSVIVVKKGEHGALLLAGGALYPFPAYPVETVVDPTGAGDSFAGAFMGALAASPDPKELGALKRAVVYGSAAASFNVGDFGTKPLESLDRRALDARFRDYVSRVSVPEEIPAVSGA